MLVLLLQSSRVHALLTLATGRVTRGRGPTGANRGMRDRDTERDLRKKTVYCSPAWDCEKGSLM